MERGNNVPRNYLGVAEISHHHITVIRAGVKMFITKVLGYENKLNQTCEFANNTLLIKLFLAYPC